MRRSRTVTLALVLAAWASLAAADDPKHLITCATVAPEGSPWMKILGEMDADLRKRTGGEVGFRFYAGGIQGQEKTVVEKIRGGQLNAAGLTGIGLGDLLPDLRVLELPLHFKSVEEYDHVRGKLWQHFLREMYKKGYLLLGLSEGGFAYMWSQREIKSLDDLRASKIWLLQGDPLVEGTFQYLKINPVPLPLSDVLTSLQSGQIDTVYVSPLALRAFQWSSKVTYRMDVPLFNILAGLVYKKEEYAKLPKPYQEALRLVCFTYVKRITLDTREKNEKDLKELGEKGMQVRVPKPEDLAYFQKECLVLGEHLAGKVYSKEIYQQTMTLLAEYRKGRGK